LKKSTHNQTFVVLKMCLQRALEDQILSNNPIKDYKLEKDVKKIDISDEGIWKNDGFQ